MKYRNLQIRLVYYIFFWIIYGGLVIQFLWNNETLAYITDILVVILFFIDKKKKDNSFLYYVGKSLPIAIVAFLIWGTIIAFIHLEPLPNILWTLKMYIRYYLMFVLIFRYLDTVEIQRLKKQFILSMKINVVIATYGYFFLSKYGDLVGGTFAGGNSELILLIMIVLFLVVGDYFQRRMSVLWMSAYIFFMFYLAIIGEMKFLYFVIPLFFYLTYVLLKRFSIKHVMMLAFAFFLFIPVLTFSLSFLYSDEYIEHYLSLEGIEEETTSDTAWGDEGSFNRGTAIALTEKMIFKNDVERITGYGFGSASASRSFMGTIYADYGWTRFNYFTYSYLLIETGWIGLILFMLIHILLLFRYIGLYFKYKNDLVMKYWSVMGILSVIVTFIMMWYNNKPIWNYYIFYYFWALCFAAIRCRQKELSNGMYFATNLV